MRLLNAQCVTPRVALLRGCLMLLRGRLGEVRDLNMSDSFLVQTSVSHLCH